MAKSCKKYMQIPRWVPSLGPKRATMRRHPEGYWVRLEAQQDVVFDLKYALVKLQRAGQLVAGLKRQLDDAHTALDCETMRADILQEKVNEYRRQAKRLSGMDGANDALP